MLVVKGAVAGFMALWLCVEVEEPDGDNPMDRICHACPAAKSSTKDAVTAPAGKHRSTDKEGRETGPWKSSF